MGRGTKGVGGEFQVDEVEPVAPAGSLNPTRTFSRQSHLSRTLGKHSYAFGQVLLACPRAVTDLITNTVETAMGVYLSGYHVVGNTLAKLGVPVEGGNPSHGEQDQ